MDEKTLKTEIQKLLDRLERAKTQDKYKTYNEENTKKDFILPLFKLLGWNVDDSEEVKAEEKVSKKRVDYAFRINGVVKFYLEAKSLKENISDPKFAKQAIEYAWNKSVPWAILCNFQGIRVFNADWKWDDKQPMRNQFLDLRYTEFLGACYEYLTWLSRDSFEQGMLDKKATSLSKKQKKLPIDKQLLADFTNYRELLSKDILKNNPKLDLSQDDLDECVQRILDRIIFIRTCEDKEIESEKLESEIRMHGDKEGQLYKELHKKFREYDNGYNSKLFREHLCENVVISNDVLKEVISGTYRSKYLDIQYDFSAIGADVLGNIYEQYLGHILKKTTQRAKLTNGKAHRKEQGIYYTPTYIVDYIVRNTVGDKLKQRKAKVDELKILDPACGSGSFLLKAFDFICEYEIKKEGKILQTKFEDNSENMILKRKTELLKNCIFGVDLDQQAVEISQLNLLLKLAEKRQRLPTLQENIRNGNSLIDDSTIAGNKSFKWEEQFKQIMESGGFDIVIGNPPYGMVTDDNLKNFYEKRFNTVEGRFDTFELFIEKGINLCKKGGMLGYIVPTPLLSNLYSRKLRKYILENCIIKEIINFEIDVFNDPTVHTCIIILQKEKNSQNNVKIKKQIKSIEKLNMDYDYKIPQKLLGANQNFTYDIFVNPDNQSLINKISKRGELLSDICYIRQCIKTGNDSLYVKSSDLVLDKPWKLTLKGKSINRYRTIERNLYIKYGSWLARNWKNISFYETPKIVIRETGSRIIATIDQENRYLLSSLYSIYPKNKDEKHSLFYFLGILNSKLATYFIKIIALELTKGAFTKVRTNQLGRFPVYLIDFNDKNDKIKYEKMVQLVQRILLLNQHLNEIGEKKTDERARVEDEIKNIDNEIDNLVYELYDLTQQEIAIIEENLK